MSDDDDICPGCGGPGSCVGMCLGCAQKQQAAYRAAHGATPRPRPIGSMRLIPVGLCNAVRCIHIVEKNGSDGRRTIGQCGKSARYYVPFAIGLWSADCVTRQKPRAAKPTRDDEIADIIKRYGSPGGCR